MIQSMTGYGKEVIQLPSKTITIEIKSLNSKGLDLNTRIPSAYREKELEMRDILAKSMQRGKVDFSIYIEVTGEATTTQLNEVIVKQYIKQLSNVVNGDPVELLKMAVRMPDALKTEKEEIDENEYNAILEGITKVFVERIENISKLLEEVIAVDPERIPAVKERLHKAISDLKEKVDENRFEQELVYYLEKYDITEEIVRLRNHLNYFKETLNSDDSNGKKLGFITQEIGREINTIGSKANYAPMQQLVVQMKDELEKIKEQALNVL